MNITSSVRRRRLVGALAAALVGLALFLSGGATPAHGVELPT